jgi:hypothetical protein
VLHNANWDEKTDLDGKKVTAIGNGASAVPVPAIQPSESLNGCVRPPAANSGFSRRVQVAELFQNTIVNAAAYVLRWKVLLDCKHPYLCSLYLVSQLLIDTGLTGNQKAFRDRSGTL